jgi:hypothetical protein
MSINNTIKWQDGTFDYKRTCVDCGKENCANPVYVSWGKDKYKEIVVSKAYKNWEESNDIEELQ